MKTWSKLTFNRVFFGALILLIAVNVTAFVLHDELIIQTVTPLFIPVFLIFFFVTNKSLGIAFISFLIFSFLGDASSMFLEKETLIQTSSILYLLSYLYLIIIVVPKFKLFEMNKLVGAYLFVVFIITLYFLYIIYGILQTVIPNTTEILLFGIKNLTLVILAFVSFGVYLNTQTKQSTLFLTAVTFFSLSAMLNYITYYYLYNWSFELLQKILYGLGLYVIFKYIIIQKANKKSKPLTQISENYSSNNILA